MKHILLILLVCNVSLAKNCDNALSACKVLVTDQDQSITMLKQQNKVLEEKAVEASPALPWYIYVLGGAALGSLGALYLEHR